MSFIETLKLFIQPSVPNNLSYSDLLDHFGSTISGIIEVRIDEIDRWLDEMDSHLKAFFTDHDFAEYGANMEMKFNSLIESQLSSWITIDDALQQRFRTYWNAYRQMLASHDMLPTLRDQLEHLAEDVTKLTIKANS